MVNNRIKSYCRVFYQKSKLMLEILENLYSNYRQVLIAQYKDYDILKTFMMPWIEVMRKSKEFKNHNRR